MEIKGYIFLPKSELDSSETVIAWVTNAYEQGGYYRTLGEAKADSKSYDLKEWALIPISFITREPIEID